MVNIEITEKRFHSAKLNILTLLKTTNAQFSVKEISEICKIERSVAQKHLTEMWKLRLLKKRKVIFGKGARYEFELNF